MTAKTKKLKKNVMKREQLITLYFAIREAKHGQLSKQTLAKYILLRMKIKAVAEDFEKVRQEVSEQTKPDGWKEGDSTKAWDEAFHSVLQAWMGEQEEIDTKIFSEADCVDFILSNPDRNGVFGDMIMENFKK